MDHENKLLKQSMKNYYEKNIYKKNIYIYIYIFRNPLYGM